MDRLRDLVRRALLARLTLATSTPAPWQVGKDDEVDVALADDTTRPPGAAPERAAGSVVAVPVRVPAASMKGSPRKGCRGVVMAVTVTSSDCSAWRRVSTRRS